jgi:hypothetical protein
MRVGCLIGQLVSAVIGVIGAVITVIGLTRHQPPGQRLLAVSVILVLFALALVYGIWRAREEA